MIEVLRDPGIARNLMSTLLLFFVVLMIRLATVRSLRRSQVPLDTKRQWIVQAKNTTVALLILGLFFVWGAELRTFALSVVAIAAALVIATKELILCVLGGILKAMTRPFKIGDRIELNSANPVRGDVISHNFLTTRLFEIGPGKLAHQYTGKSIVIPNSVFLSTSIFIEPKSSHFGLHTFSVFRPVSIDIKSHKNLLLNAAKEVCGQYASKAQKYLQDMGDVEGLEAPTAEPRVLVLFPSHDKIEFVLRIPVESLRAGKAEQSILEKYIEGLSKLPPLVSNK